MAHKADVNIASDDGCTALMYAIRKGCTEIIEVNTRSVLVFTLFRICVFRLW